MIEDILSGLENNFGRKKYKDESFVIDNLGLKGLFNKDLLYGKIIEISGKESSGKSTFLYHLLPEFNDVVLLFDTEYQFDKDYANRYTNIKKLFLCQENNPEKILDIISQTAGLINIIYIDSFSAINFEEYGELEIFFDKLTKLIKQNNILLIMTNQVRAKLRTKKTVAFGSQKQKHSYWIRLKTEKYRKNHNPYILVRNKDFLSKDYSLDLK